jgi:hypothetical protein
MSALVVRIDTGNDAFGPTFDDWNREVARILREFADRLERDDAMTGAPDRDEYVLRDANGARVGFAAFVGSKR